jgi:hypothetical protein
MSSWIYIASVAVLGLVLLACTGWWRLLFAAFAIRPNRMTVDRLGLAVTSPEDIHRVNTLLRNFAGGFNAMITAPTDAAWRSYCETVPVLFRPFAEEGAAMGYTLRHLFMYDPAGFEERLVKQRPEFRYLYYVGLGFWSGMRGHDSRRLSRVVDGLDPLHRFLCYDGYGFKHAFFDYPKDRAAFAKFDSIDGYARNATYQGVGRAFYFFFMARPDELIEHIDRLGIYAADAAAGAGLAAAFVNPDRLEVARNLAEKMPPRWHEHFHLGMCFGLKARSINNVDQFERDMATLDPSVQDAACTSIRECDRIELLMRAEQREDGYRRWRRQVTDWMAEHIEYPLAGVRKSTSVSRPPVPIAAQARCGTETRGHVGR